MNIRYQMVLVLNIVMRFCIGGRPLVNKSFTMNGLSKRARLYSLLLFLM